MNNVATLFFDESGTPAGDNLLIVGGFAIKGDIQPVLEKWNNFLNANNLRDKKGRRYSKDNFLDLSKFIYEEKIIPITSHTYMDRNDLDYLRAKIKDYRKAADQFGGDKLAMSPDRYLWILQISITIAFSIISISINIGKVDNCEISVDKYLSNQKLQNIMKQVIQNFFDPSGYNNFIKPFIAKYPFHPETIKLVKNLKPGHKFISLNPNARGKFKLLSDAVCAMYRKKLLGDDSAKGAWHVLTLFFRKNNKIPMFLDNDVTQFIREVARKPWAIPR